MSAGGTGGGGRGDGAGNNTSDPRMGDGWKSKEFGRGDGGGTRLISSNICSIDDFGGTESGGGYITAVGKRRIACRNRSFNSLCDLRDLVVNDCGSGEAKGDKIHTLSPAPTHILFSIQHFCHCLGAKVMEP